MPRLTVPHYQRELAAMFGSIKSKFDFRKQISTFAEEKLLYQLIAHHIDKKNENWVWTYLESLFVRKCFSNEEDL